MVEEKVGAMEMNKGVGVLPFFTLFSASLIELARRYLKLLQ